MQNVNIATSVTEILAADSTRHGQEILLQNQSDTTMRVAIGADNALTLTSTLGFSLEAGEGLLVSGAPAARRICAIHGGSGNKVAHWQRV